MIEIIPNWHPVVVHFTIALLLTSSSLFVIATFLSGHPSAKVMTNVARWNLALGVAATVLTLATGWQAYNTVAHDEPSHANMTVHSRWALGAGALFLAAAAAAWLDRRRITGAGFPLLALVVSGSAALAVTGWLGGENVYRYGLGVMSLPKSDMHMHPGADGVPATEGHRHGSAVPDGGGSGVSTMGAGGNGAASPDVPPSPPVPKTGRQHEHTH